MRGCKLDTKKNKETGKKKKKESVWMVKKKKSLLKGEERGGRGREREREVGGGWPKVCLGLGRCLGRRITRETLGMERERFVCSRQAKRGLV